MLVTAEIWLPARRVSDLDYMVGRRHPIIPARCVAVVPTPTRCQLTHWRMYRAVYMGVVDSDAFVMVATQP